MRHPALRRLASLALAPVAALACGRDPHAPPAAPETRVTLELAPKDLLVRIGVSERLTVYSSPPQPSSALRWRSSAPALVSVSDSGEVVAHAAAVVRITVWLARDSTVRDSARISVLNDDEP